VIAWWPFDETSGTIAADIVGTEQAAYFGSPTPSVGEVGDALLFHGNTGSYNGDFLAAGASSQWDFGTGDFTVELWANLAVVPGGDIPHPGAIFIGDDEGPGYQNKWIFALGAGVLEIIVYNVLSPPSNFFLVRAPFTPVVGQWYHLAAVKSGTLFTIFVNGVPVGSEVSTSPIANVNAPLTIGQAESLGFMNGLLDEVTVYNRALTQTELESIFSAGSAGKCKPPTAGSPALVPTTGGNLGQTTLTITGVDFTSATTALLVKGAQQIAAASVQTSADGKTLQATFNLTGQPQGLWDLDLTTPGQPPTVLAQAFTIEQAQPVQLWSDIVGRGAVRIGFADQVQVTFGNRSNVDAHNVVVWLAVPSGIAASPTLPYLEATDVPLNDPPVSINGQTYYWFFTDVLSAGETRTIPVGVLSSALGQFALQTGIFDGTSLLQSLSGQQSVLTSLASKSTFAAPSRQSLDPKAAFAVSRKRLNTASVLIVSNPQPGDIVFKTSDPGQAPTGHVGFYIGAPAGTCPSDCVIDFVPVGILGNGLIQGQVRVLPLSQWATNPGTYLGSATPPGLTNAEATAAVQTAINLAEFPPTGPFMIPPSALGDDCVSFVDSIYRANRASGYTPLWDDWSSPASIYNYTTGNIFPGPIWHTWRWLQVFTSALLPRFQAQVYQVSKIMNYRVVNSLDPNEKAGSPGVGTQQYISGQEPLRYTIFFENSASATAPAQQVIVTDQLQTSNLDLSTVSLGTVSFGSHQVPITPGLSDYLTDIDLRPATPLIARIHGSLKKSTGILSWQLTSLDPSTGQLTTDPLAGFLPPNLVPPQGEGTVSFTVMPRSGVPTGTQIQNGATIVFDLNAPISTPTWLNTLDNTPPTSSVKPLPPNEPTSGFTVNWSGTDVGAGIQDFTIYVSDNGGLFAAFLTNTTATSATFTGQSGHTYGFYSIARDLVGNVEGAKTTAEATTECVSGPGANLSPESVNFGNVYLGTRSVQTLTLTNTGNATLTIERLKVLGGNDNDDFKAHGACPRDLVAGKSCKIIVSFVADRDNYNPTGTLAITDNALGSPQSVPLSATVINPKASLSTYRLNFANQKVNTTSGAKRVTLTNTGTTPLALSGLTVSGDFALAPGTACVNGGTLLPATSCAISVTFTPAAKGTRVGSVTIKDNARLSAQTIALAGTGD
jgi:hypothetical protein